MKTFSIGMRAVDDEDKSSLVLIAHSFQSVKA
jgi:hypothetical protein